MVQVPSYENRTKEEIGNASCYMWVTFVLLTVSGLCFAVGAAQPVLFIVAIVIAICACSTATLYIVRVYEVRKLKSGCETTTDNEEKGFCTSCCKRVLCLTNEEYGSRTGGNASTPGTEHVYVASVDSPAEDPLAKISRAITRIRQQYAFLKRQECVDSIIERDFVSLDAEEEKVRLWGEEGIPSESDIESMNERLKRIARDFRLARLRINNQQYSGTSGDLQVEVDMDAPEQVQLFDTDVAMPPSYSQLDLEQLHTHHNGRTCNLYIFENQRDPAICTLRPNELLPTESFGSVTSDNIVPPFSVVSQVNQNSAWFRAIGRQDSLDPPLDESDAPPAYDEVTASPV